MRTKVAMLIASVSTIALGTVAQAQSQTQPASDAVPTEDIIVTGSRVVANGNNAPTPLTVVATDDLKRTTPTTIVEALNKMPMFTKVGGPTRGPAVGNGNNQSGSYLSLRGFGTNRNLILLDGRRAPPTSLDNSVDLDTLPEMLTRRVDVVTGGASAVYGSDAVTGVVNYVLDHNFKGVRVDLQNGISNYGDGRTWKAGIAAGTSLMDDRLHIEGSYEHYEADGIHDKHARPWGQKDYCQVGAGNAASPITFATNCRFTVFTDGGRIFPFGLNFRTDGVLSPFVNGTPTASFITQQGGDGRAGTQPSTLSSDVKRDQAFARLSYDLGGDTHLFAQGNWSRSETHTLVYQLGGPLGALNYSTNNAYLTPTAQAQLGGPNQVFSMFRELDPVAFDNHPTTKAWSGTVGIDGRLGSRFNWSFYYSHSTAKVAFENIRNMNRAKLLVALDAVRDPATGNIVCNVSLNPVTAAMYPGCVPINPFGPTAPAPGAWNYPEVTTTNVMTNKMDDWGGTVSGDLFTLPAGPVKVAVSGEYRKMALTNKSDFRPSQTVQNTTQCVGINYGNCNPAGNNLLYIANTAEPMSAKENIGEIAGEVNVPILKDSAIARSLDINGAVRWASYSVSGKATTWKIGAVWEVIDGVTFRVARSRDIRAPTLLDLFGPVSANVIGFTDPLIEVNGQRGDTYPVLFQTQGNQDLVPEVAQTWTAGVVLRPAFLPRFSLAVDYYNIKMNNAVANLAGSAATVRTCEQTNGTSPLCALVVRPISYTNTTQANRATLVLSNPLNIANTETHGVDIEANYNFDISKVGHFDVRLLANYQPELNSQTIPGQPVINAQGYANGNPVWRAALTLGYSSGPVSINVLERWRSSLKPDSNTATVYNIQNPPAAAYTDLNINVAIDAGKVKPSLFLSVTNLFNKQPFPFPQFASFLTNFNNPVINGDDVLGRYFTAGFRVNF